MQKYLDTVQKRIGTLISAVGLFVLINNIAHLIVDRQMSFWEILTNDAFYVVAVLVIPFIVSMFVESALLKYLQIASFLLMGAANIFDAYQEFYGPAMFLAAWLLTRHYGYLEKRAFAKNTAFIVALTVLSQASAIIHAKEGIYAGTSTLLFTLFLVALLVIIWRDLVRQQKTLTSENQALKMDYTKLANQLRELEAEHKPYDLKAVKITPAEERVIKTLTVYRASNREIAERLNIAESTVKLHMYNICNKIGVDNRFAIAELCKYNFE